jgi:hypothetical protein
MTFPLVISHDSFDRLARLGVFGMLAILAGCDSGASEGGTAGVTENAAAQAPLPSDDELAARIDAALVHTLHERELRLDTHAAWQIIHGVVAYGPKFPVMHGDEQVAALDWVLAGGAMKGWTMRPGSDGVESVLEAGSKSGQGHPDQWLGYIALWGLPSSTPLVVDGKEFTIGDLITQAMKDVRDGKEATWTLLALSEYLHPTQEWPARDGSVWTLERLVAMEAAADLTDDKARDHINSAACGGSHRMTALARALNRYGERMPQAEGGTRQLTGGWAAANERVQWAIEQARANQLPTGGFSVNYFSRPSDSADLSEHLGATGHTLEFLTFALDDKELAEPWVARAANFLCGVFEKTKSIDLECGALYHAASSLARYRQRRFGAKDYFEIEP